MANFDLYLPTLLSHEGGFNDIKGDSGGATNKGVSLRFALSTLDLDKDGFKDADFDKDGDIDVDDIKKVSKEDAKKIYKLYFWDKIKGDQITSQSVAEIVFDHAVNAGVQSASKLLQRALNSMFSEVIVDGDLGPKTIMFTNKTNGKVLFNLIKQGRVDFYNNLVAQKPTLEKFKKGWLNRISTFQYK